jgi:hypothetical protein
VGQLVLQKPQRFNEIDGRVECRDDEEHNLRVPGDGNARGKIRGMYLDRAEDLGRYLLTNLVQNDDELRLKVVAHSGVW